jgi:hypothetical protein
MTTLYFLRTIMEDRKKGLYLEFFEEKRWREAERSSMAAFLRKYSGNPKAPPLPPGRDTWTDLVVKRIGDGFVPLWRTDTPSPATYEVVDEAMRDLREKAKRLRTGKETDPKVKALLEAYPPEKTPIEILKDTLDAARKNIWKE